MSARGRKVAVIAGGLGLAALYLWGASGLPPAGVYHGPYGIVLNQVAVTERHSTDIVTSVNFDYRGFDTLGEEFILFASVIGAALLLRKQKDEAEQGEDSKDSGEDKAASRRPPPPSDAVRTLGVGLVGINVVFGLYIITHGQVSPGGGFQGGVILATAPLLVYLAGDPRRFLRIVPHTLVEVAESCGATGFVLLGLLGLLRAAAFLQNVVPLGPPDGKITSGGTIPLISATTGLEVAAGFVLLLSVFLEQTLQKRLKHEREEK
ncbi:MAG: MnhB domain-containing protein [Hyalangium sp.]|uniref:MnhB domain-containing protein n=1 Tax=Hyalangium sp. TaxID=2028555 RepID=UPI0038999D69